MMHAYSYVRGSLAFCGPKARSTLLISPDEVGHQTAGLDSFGDCGPNSG